MLACLNMDSTVRCMVSCVFVLLAQFSISLIPRFFSASSLLVQLVLSALVLLSVVGIGTRCRRLVGVYASAPAFVFFNILFIWLIYMSNVRQAIPLSINVVFNLEVAMLFVGLYSILSSDPGLVSYGSSHSDKLFETRNFGVDAHNEDTLLKRVRYCKHCNAHVKGFDHHCPAFGNCIGQNNYVLFIVLLVGFLITESSYTICLSQFSSRLQVSTGTILETSLAKNIVLGTRLFCLLQVLWQVVFLAWHVYCICFNIRTDEWVNWEKYPEFQLIEQSQPGESFVMARFRNPYDRGIFQNVKDFLAIKDTPQNPFFRWPVAL